VKKMNKKKDEAYEKKTDDSYKNASEQSIRRLYRSKVDKIIAGVCGGIAEYYNIDPVWVRLAAVLLLFADGAGILVYIIAWVLIPQNPNQEEKPNTRAERIAETVSAKVDVAAKRFDEKIEGRLDSKDEKKREGNSHIILGAVFILLGAGYLLKQYLQWLSFMHIFAAALIVVGIYYIFNSKRN
jgi:phage shock protein C